MRHFQRAQRRLATKECAFHAGVGHGFVEIRVDRFQVDQAAPIDRRLHAVGWRCAGDGAWRVQRGHAASDADHRGQVAARRNAPGGKTRPVEIIITGMGAQESNGCLDVDHRGGEMRFACQAVIDAGHRIAVRRDAGEQAGKIAKGTVVAGIAANPIAAMNEDQHRAGIGFALRLIQIKRQRSETLECAVDHLRHGDATREGDGLRIIPGLAKIRRGWRRFWSWVGGRRLGGCQFGGGGLGHGLCGFDRGSGQQQRKHEQQQQSAGTFHRTASLVRK